MNAVGHKSYPPIYVEWLICGLIEWIPNTML